MKSDVRSLEVEHPEKNGTLWLVNLVINQHLPKGKNIPYEFSLDVTGLVAAHPSLKGEKLERLIKANGPSMLFGSAREIIRAATGRGPFAPVIIPSTNFLGHLPEKEPEKQKKPARTTRKAVKKKTAKKSLPVAKRAKEKSDSQ
ncbi:MAG: protein-export chaperone SecB [Opitutales bacterium]|nr:protein-export chaperone SecB [Opitutales bacterium]